MAFGSGFQERLAIIISADAQGAIREVRKLGDIAERDLGRAEKSSEKLANRFAFTGAAMLGSSVVIGRGLLSTVKSAQDSEAAHIRLENTLRNMPRLAGANEQAFLDQASALQKVTVVSDEEIVSAQAMLGTFKVTESQIRGLIPLIVDYSRKFGTDTTTAALQVGKALDGQVGALKRNGVSIDEVLFKTDRYAAVTKALREQVGGFAEREGKTFDGQLKILSNQADEFKESVGRGVVDVLSKVLPAATSAARGIGSVDEKTGNMIGKVATVGAATTGAIGGTLLLASATMKLKSSFAEGGVAAGGFGTAIQGIGVVGGVVAGTTALISVIDELTGYFHDGELAADRFARKSRDEAATAFLDLAQNAKRSADDLARSNSSVDAQRRAYSLLGKTIKDEFLRMLQQPSGLGTGEKIIEGLKGQSAAAKAAGIDIGALETALRRETTAQKNAAQDTQASSDALDQNTQALQDNQQALDEQSQALLASFDSQLGFERAQTQVNDALGEYNAKAKEAADAGGKNVEKNREAADALEAAKEAALNAAGAQVRLYDDTAKANGQTLDAKQKQALYRQSLEQTAGTLAPGSPLRVYLEGLIGKLDEAAKDRTAHVGVSVTGDTDKLEQVAKFVSASGAGISVQVNTGHGRYARAMGGPIPGATGEAVPIVAHGGEYVLSADVVQRIKAGRASQGARVAGGTTGDGGWSITGPLIVQHFDGTPSADVLDRANQSALEGLAKVLTGAARSR